VERRELLAELLRDLRIACQKMQNVTLRRLFADSGKARQERDEATNLRGLHVQVMPGIFTPPVTFSSSASMAFSACSSPELTASTAPSSASSIPSLFKSSGSISIFETLRA